MSVAPPGPAGVQTIPSHITAETAPEAAVRLRRLGYLVLPIPPGRKSPPPRGWVETEAEYVIPDGSNLAIATRGELSILITNDEPATAWATARYGSPHVWSRRGGHWYFRSLPGQKNEANTTTAVGTIELHVRNKYALIPPSVHPEGTPEEPLYRWGERPLPALGDLPDVPDLRDLFHPKGTHHAGLLRISCAAAAAGKPEAQVFQELREWVDGHLPDPDAHPDAELRDMAQSAVGKYGTPPPTSGAADPFEGLREAVAQIGRCLRHPNARTADGMVPLLLVDLLVDQYGDTLRYDVDSGHFRVYRDGIWPEDRTGAGEHCVLELLGRIDDWTLKLLEHPVTQQWFKDWKALHEAEKQQQRKAGVSERNLPKLRDVTPPPSPVPGIDDETWKVAVLGAEDLRTFRAERSHRREVDDAIHVLRTRPEIAIESKGMNSDPWTLPVRTGLLDLKSGMVRPYDMTSIWTWKSPYVPNRLKPPEKWLAFLEKFAPTPEVRGYLQRLAYYCLTGDTGEQAVFDLWGPGRNGKTTWIEVVAGLIPGATVRADPATFGERATDRIPNDLARLRGARLVVVPEPPRGMRLNEDLIHRFSGGDQISARFLHREYFEYVPSAKLLFYGSEKLRIVGQTPATWRRFKFIKALNSFPVPGEPENLKNYHTTLLAEEGDAILAWALDARQDFLAHGLATPTAIAEDTQELREEADWLAAFLLDCVSPRINSIVPAAAMRNALAGWAIENNEPALLKTSARRLSTELVERGYKKSTRHGSAYSWADVTLTSLGVRCAERGAPPVASVRQRNLDGEQD